MGELKEDISDLEFKLQYIDAQKKKFKIASVNYREMAHKTIWIGNNESYIIGNLFLWNNAYQS